MKGLLRPAYIKVERSFGEAGLDVLPTSLSASFRETSTSMVIQSGAGKFLICRAAVFSLYLRDAV
jgi:hypothetical protein